MLKFAVIVKIIIFGNIIINKRAQRPDFQRVEG